MEPVVIETPADTSLPQQPVVATVDGWTVASASVHPPTEAQLVERMGGTPEPDAAALAAAEAAKATPEAKPDAAAEAAASTEEAARVAAEDKTPGQEAAKPAPKPKKGSPEHRIAQATFHQREAERVAAEHRAENERLRLELESLKKPAEKKPDTPTPASGTAKPTWAAMEAEGHTYDEFLDARDEWARTDILAAAEKKAAETIATQHAADREASNTEQRNRAFATEVASFAERLDAERKVTPNFDELIDPELPVQPWMQKAIRVSEIGPKVMLYLNVNPEECRRIAGLDPATALYEMGKIEGQLHREIAASSGTAKPAGQTTNAKPPTRQVGSSARTGTTTTAASSDEFDADWVRKENERERQARLRRV